MSAYNVNETDPEVGAVVKMLPEVITGFALTVDNVEMFRALAAQLSPDVPYKDPDLSRELIDDQHEGKAVQVYKYQPKNLAFDGTSPAVFWIHGGGYVQGDAKDDANASDIARALNCPVYSVEYRLAPEHPFPAGHDDCLLAYKWMVDKATELGIDAQKIAIAGSSAGGGLSAGLMLKIRDEGLQAPSCVVMRAPMIDNLCMTPSSNVTGYPLWKSETNKAAWTLYLGAGHGKDASPYAAASRASDLSKLPPSLITVGSQDAFVDENKAFSKALQQAGSPSSIEVYQGGIHGSDSLNRPAALSQRIISDEIAFIRKHI